MNKKVTSILIVISIMVISISGTSYALEVKEVAKEIKMENCDMLISVCQTDAAQQMKDSIADKIDKGMSKQEIIDDFIEEYGEEVYAAPTKEGFNLVAWIMPFLAIVIGGIAIYYFTRKWTIAHSGNENKEITEKQVSSEEEKEIEEELKKYL